MALTTFRYTRGDMGEICEVTSLAINCFNYYLEVYICFQNQIINSSEWLESLSSKEVLLFYETI